MNSIPRFDYEFSYWIFAGYILYEFDIIDYNPKYLLLFALLVNCCILLLMLYYNNSYIYIFLYCFINLFIKGIPLWRLRNTNYDQNDIIAYGLLFVIYLGWLFINNIDFNNLFLHTKFNAIKNNKPATPFIYYIAKTFDLS